MDAFSENCPEFDIFDLHARFCAIFSSPIRLKIMWALGDGEKTVTELAEGIGISVTNISQHLRVMRDQGGVGTRREGRMVYYHIANPKFMQGARLIREGLLEEFQKRGAMDAGRRKIAGGTT